ncbi:hypothetical protein M408DRAFT_29474 [Serendipita vermifera MAFF 305830]|uniref:C2H2-type domain-containing protein n=1 Tax=Serendipita vermifera MAFF 305830 TaxID=933852 RepID=A0A0C3AQP4_SERVB|nr:hypothetical protein M408DRAFT_29474 [Serendipita vermifera MAFF 305830]
MKRQGFPIDSFEEALVLAGKKAGDSYVLEESLLYFEDLKAHNPALFEIIDKDTKEISHLLDIISTDALEVVVYGVRKYACVQCGRTHDRKQRANDCRYFDLKLKPYLCHGTCGLDSCDKSYASKQLLNRHCKDDQVKKCVRCASRIFFEETLRPTGEQVDNAHVEQTSQYFERLKATDPTLFETLNKDIKDLSRIFDIITSDAPELDVDGVRKFGCVQCGKTLIYAKEAAVRTEAIYLRNKEQDISRASREEAPALTGEQVVNTRALEEASQYFEYLKANDPALCRVLDKDANELSQILDIITSDTPEVYVDGVRKFACVKCGKTYDRKLRANDCRYSDLNLKPYLCYGNCRVDSCNKSYASKELLNRHCEYGQVRRCSRCGGYQLKQNSARHRSSCQG